MDQARAVIGASQNDGPSVEAQALSQADLIFASKHPRPVVKVMKPRIASQLATTDPTAPPLNVTPPVIAGTGTVGQTLRITDGGTWISGGSRTYKWQRDAVDIVGATLNSYVLVAADSTHSVRAVVVQTNSHGSTNANSNAIAVT
jgi:hypothetical protein